MLLETARRALTRRNVKWLLTRPENHFKLGADHLTLEGGGGGGEWVILKKSFPQALVGRKKLRAALMKKKKNSCTAASKNKNVAKLFHHSWGAL